jgi:hypothetical protein
MKNQIKILVYDLEISPTLGWTYGQWQTNVIRVEREPHIMCFAYKWLGSPTRVVSQTDFKGYKKNRHDDREVVEKLWELLNEADIVIAHNAKKFDNKVANERFLVHDLGPVSPYHTIDTLTEARSKFKNGSNSLNNLCQKLELGSKTQDKHADLWRACLDGCEDSWRKMIRYCKQDVNLLEKLYLKIRPFIAHPNIATFINDREACPKCGGHSLQYRGYERTKTCTYHRVYCNDCRSWLKERQAEKDFDKPNYI